MLLNFLTKLTAPIGHKEHFKISNVRFLLVVTHFKFQVYHLYVTIPTYSGM